MKKLSTLYSTGFLQVSLVVVQTWAITHSPWYVVGFIAFLISLVWAFNVKSVSIGRKTEGVIYAMGAATGAVVGLLFGRGVL